MIIIRKQRYLKMYVRNRPSIRVAVLGFYLSTSTREKQHPNAVVIKKQVSRPQNKFKTKKV